MSVTSAAPETVPVTPPLPGQPAARRTLDRVWEGLILLVLGGAGFWMTLYHQGMLPPALTDFRAIDLWFQSDVPRIYTFFADVTHTPHRALLHPFYSVYVGAMSIGLRELLGADTMGQMRLASALTNGVWVGVFYMTLRWMGLRRPESVLFALIGLTSASAVFLFAVPETFHLSSLVMLRLLGLAAWAGQQTLPFWALPVLQALSVTGLVTNLWIGWAVSWFHTHRRRFLVSAVLGLALVGSLLVLQYRLLPQTINSPATVGDEHYFLFTPGNGSLWLALQSFLVHSIVMPAVQLRVTVWPAGMLQYSVQDSLAGSGTPLGVAAVGLWLVLLGAGGWALVKDIRQSRFKQILATCLAGYLALFAVYGDETFLYSLVFMPLLVLTAAFSTTVLRRRWVLGLCTLLLLLNGLNNLALFHRLAHGLCHYTMETRQIEPAPDWSRRDKAREKQRLVEYSDPPLVRLVPYVTRGFTPPNVLSTVTVADVLAFPPVCDLQRP